MSSTGHPLSPLGGQHGMPQLVAPRPQGLDSNQLKARLYAKSEIHTSTRPVLKVVRRRPRKDEVRKLVPALAIHALWISQPYTGASLDIFL